MILIQMMFGDQELEEQVFDYSTYELKLQPLLAKLLQIREEYQEYDDAIYNMFLGMLEIDENDRFTFQ